MSFRAIGNRFLIAPPRGNEQNQARGGFLDCKWGAKLVLCGANPVMKNGQGASVVLPAAVAFQQDQPSNVGGQ